MTGNTRRQPTVAGTDAEDSGHPVSGILVTEERHGSDRLSSEPCRDRISQLVASLLEESQKPYSATLASHLVNCRSCLQTLVALEAAFELDRAVHDAQPVGRSDCDGLPVDGAAPADRGSANNLK